MFTGLVEELGSVQAVESGAQSARITVRAKVVVDDLKMGDSIAVNGTCLTVVAFGADWFTADVMPETMRRTVLGTLQNGEKVNLERTLRVGDRLGGHIVSGHIDGVGSIRRKERNDNAIVISIAAPEEVMRYVVEKGSITIDGISLTIVALGPDWFSVSLIPHTAALTTLGHKGVGGKVNLEGDIIGKYVEKLLSRTDEQATKPNKSGLNLELLQKNGFL
jgi:riboflavin synthase